MTPISAKAEPNSTWRRVRHILARMRDWPLSDNNPYSPFLCFSLLFGAALIFETGR